MAQLRNLEKISNFVGFLAIVGFGISGHSARPQA